MVIAATNQAIAEALTLAEASGIDRAAAYDTLASSAISSPFIHYKRQAYLAPDDGAVAFTTALISKDLELAQPYRCFVLPSDSAQNTRLCARHCR